ncbi:acyl carrier protein phosphodiesterase [Dyadobacter arcticus]|uniref:Acyl carrier protein phosphodiesterase n=1 Tax=Dyadobacter arcticus TaxID=1078754 RepID=A0ABX0UQ83_9BACT|nr:ACP phosphodiesterase [Dyadobacter arcticus]NIJ54114.1 acyl carrier protein phosphodiesterase [Dyadobacter arcticus]
MNFLAHILLSGEREGVLMGNYVGDFIKGRLTEEKTVDWNQDYVLGLKLHRFIDSFTDTHPEVQEAKHLAALSLGKLAGIVMDIYFDYFLASHFSDFSKDSLSAYVHAKYAVIEKNDYLVPQDMIPMVRSMIRQDWLTSYATFEGIDLTFQRLSRRAKFLAPISNAVNDLRANEDFYYQKFQKFFPELQMRSALFIAENGSGIFKVGAPL